MENRLSLRPRECAEAMGLGRSTVYALIASGELPSFRVRGAVRVPVDRLREWIEVRVALESGAVGTTA
jgi:excisionase family DNA binding protein